MTYGHLRADCLHTGISSGTNARYRVWEAFTFYLYVSVAGRTHQLRVHCCALGHRVIGDYMYSDRQDASPRRMMLHAVRLVVPMKRERVDVSTCDPFTSDLEPDWRASRTFHSYDEFCGRS